MMVRKLHLTDLRFINDCTLALSVVHVKSDRLSFFPVSAWAVGHSGYT